MKLRISQRSLRFRLRQGEVADLAAGLALRETLDLPTGAFHYALTVEDLPALVVAYQPDHLEIRLPRQATATWANSNEETLAGEVATPGGQLLVQVEKDYRCLHRNSASDEDTFPHPAQSSAAQ